MGILLSRFRKKKTTIQVLEDLDTKIKEIQRYGQTTEQRHKKIVGTLIIWSVVLYIIAALVFYFYFFPASLRDRFFYITPLLIFPLLIILTKRMVTWYYNRKISRNRDKLSTMQLEKKKILDEVTETETYKKAKEILMKFAPDQLRMTPLSPQPTYKSPVTESPRRPSTPQAVVAPLPGGSELRRRALTVSNPSANVSIGRPANSALIPVGVAPAITPLRQTPFTAVSRSFNAATIGARSPLPRPILPQQRSYLDRLVEYLVGDGPSNRYALICQMCESHNGMALKEEFEFFGFRCCYCNFWNPARKQKPSAPRLENDPNSPQCSLQSPKNSGLDVSSASSSSSAKSKSEIPNTPTSPCIENPTEPPYNETPISLLVQNSNVKTIHDPRKRRRTIYQIQSYEPSDHYDDCVPETYYFSSQERTTKNLSDAECVKIRGRNSDIEVVEKPLSEQSDSETDKDSNAGTRGGEDKESSNVYEERIEKLVEHEKLENEREFEKEEEGAGESEKMEIDESPKK